MRGKEIAWRTLARERIEESCIVGDWVFHPGFWPAVTGRRLSENPLAVAVEAFRRVGANLTPQFAVGEPQQFFGNVRQAAPKSCSPEELRDAWEQLPEPSALEHDFDLAATARDYARPILDFQQVAQEDILRISYFGQVDFMGGYGQWGYEAFLSALLLYPEHAERYFAYSAASARLLNLAVVEAVRKHDLAPFVYGGQDICFNGGPLCSPQWLAQHYFPHFHKALEPLHQAGLRIIWHCDGDIRPILPSLLDIGVAGFQGFQEETGVTLREMAGLRTKWGTKPIIWGSVSVTTTLPFGTPQQVRREVERCFRQGAAGGGFALAHSSSVLPEVPIENILAFYEAGRAAGASLATLA